MTTRSHHDRVSFRHPFKIACIEKMLPAGVYDVVTDEESIDGLSFMAFRRVATRLMVPGPAERALSIQSFVIDPHDLKEALRRDDADLS